MIKSTMLHLAVRSSIKHKLSSSFDIINNPTCSIFKRFYIKNYDKAILLNPVDAEYKYNDSQFLPGPSFADEPYIKPTNDEIVELTRIKLEKEIDNSTWTKVDPNSDPFNQVLEGTDNGGQFTKVEKINEPSLWKWVERLMPKQTLGTIAERENNLVIPLPKEKPNVPYFVSRTRSRLYPLYRRYEIVGRDHKTYWRNRWDGLFNKYHTDILENLDEIKFENNEKIMVLTVVQKIQGDIWKFEQDARNYLEKIHQLKDERILTSVNEVRGSVNFKGDYVTDLFRFLKERGF